MPGQTAFSIYSADGKTVLADLEAGLPTYDPAVGGPCLNTGNSFGIDSSGNAWYYPEGAPASEVARVLVFPGGAIFIEKVSS